MGTTRTHCSTAVGSVGWKPLTQKPLLVISCPGSVTHFYWSQYGLRMDYGLTINYGAKTANRSLALLQFAQLIHEINLL